ncbi:MAG: carboxypeptidase regulatory-like domain-containing protein [Chloroflexi bacterium]|nr:carboxypeptidase regulatory-like domain-containing protein [Chloroflexota bacterium]
MTRLLLALALLAMLGRASAQAVEAQAAAGPGVIEGRVQNATPNGAVPAGLAITLHAVVDRSKIGEWQATTDAEGHYRFEGLDTNPSIIYIPVALYQGVTYFPPRPVSFGDSSSQQSDLAVYDATDSRDMVAFERLAMMVVGVEPNSLAVRQMGSVVNAGQQTVVPATRDGATPLTLRFFLPTGASDVQPEAGFLPGDLLLVPGAVGSASPLLPGRRQVAFSYLVSFSRGSAEIATRLDFPTQSFTFYVPDVGLTVNSPQLTAQGPAQLAGQNYLAFAGQNLPRGTELKVTLGGLPMAADGEEQTVPWAVVSGAALLVVGLGLALARRGMPRAAMVAVGSGADAEAQRMRLLLEIARLDERHEAGEVPLGEYERQRASAKEQLLALRRAVASGESSG